MNTKIVLISGYIGAGKTTFADYLVNYLNDNGCYAIKESFGNRVKEVAKNSFGWNGEKDEKGRKLLQLIGTEVGRFYNPDIWVNAVINKLHNMESLGLAPSVFVIDDWRFPNEYFRFVDEGYDVITVKIIGNPSSSDHISEHALEGQNINYTLQIINTYRNPETDFEAPVENFLYSKLCSYFASTQDSVERIPAEPLTK